MSEDLPDFSVIIPTYGRPGRLDRCLGAITRLDYPRDAFEVIVVDDGSPTSLGEIVERYAETLAISLLRQSHQGVSAARNHGASKACGTYLAFTADDCEPEPRWLQAMACCLRECPAGTAMGGLIANGHENNLFSEATQLVLEYVCETGGEGTLAQRFFTPNNLVVPAADFRRVGGFDPVYTLSAGEDRDYCARWIEQGFNLGFCQGAEVIHRHPLGFLGFLHLHWRYGRGSGLYRWRRARRQGRRFALERPAFYLGLLKHPMRRSRGRRLLLSALVMLSQAASAAGVLAEWGLGSGRHVRADE